MEGHLEAIGSRAKFGSDTANSGTNPSHFRKFVTGSQ